MRHGTCLNCDKVISKGVFMVARQLRAERVIKPVLVERKIRFPKDLRRFLKYLPNNATI